MIVRISTEGQYRLEDGAVERLNALDNDAVAAVDSGDEARFRKTFEEMLGLVRESGEPLAEDDLSASDIILPPPDTTLAEAAQEFTGEGLIPG